MKKEVKAIFLWIIILCGTLGHAQSPFALETSRASKKWDIPFERDGNFIILDVKFQNWMPLKFIFDTGSEYTILTQKSIAHLFQLPFERSFQIIGSDMRTQLKAHLIRQVSLDLGQVRAPAHSIIVLDEDIFAFENYIGYPIHGIIGGDMFRGYVVEIDYQRNLLSLSLPNDFKSKKYGEPIDIEITRNKPYLQVEVSINGNATQSMKMLLDTGASTNMILNKDSLFYLPAQTISGTVAMGLGGELKGYLGRVSSTTVAGYQLTGVVTHFQNFDAAMNTEHLNNRNGIIGNPFLERFDIAIDYPHHKFYIKPSRKFGKKFDYDRSGLTIIAAGENLHQYLVIQVVPYSPAAEVGIQVGDQLLNVGGISTKLISMNTVYNTLKKKGNRSIRIKYSREGKKYRTKIALRDLI